MDAYPYPIVSGGRDHLEKFWCNPDIPDPVKFRHGVSMACAEAMVPGPVFKLMYTGYHLPIWNELRYQDGPLVMDWLLPNLFDWHNTVSKACVMAQSYAPSVRVEVFPDLMADKYPSLTVTRIYFPLLTLNTYHDTMFPPNKLPLPTKDYYNETRTSY